MLYSTTVDSSGFDYIFHVKNEIAAQNEPMSLYEFLTKICKPEFNLDEIQFGYEWFEAGELRDLAMHLCSNKTNNSAIAVLTSSSVSIGHAVSMYKFCQDKQSFFYKDSSVTAYESLNLKTNSSSFSEEIEEELKLLPRQHHQIIKAWTLTATRKRLD